MFGTNRFVADRGDAPHRYYDRIIDRDSTTIYIVMEYCEGGDLASTIKQCRREKRLLSEDAVLNLFTQIVLAMQECHRRKDGAVVHRDIKPGNIFLDGHGNVKLGDFGLARVRDTGNCAYWPPVCLWWAVCDHTSLHSPPPMLCCIVRYGGISTCLQAPPTRQRILRRGCAEAAAAKDPQLQLKAAADRI
jgi:serine/threonine protein kinase